MISIQEKKNCCGCSACATVCPKKCISMAEDHEGFLYPHVTIETCIDCGLCEKVCNELHPYSESEPHKVLAAINKDEEVRLKSSSGGIFSILAEQIIREGGIVFGARFDENWQVVIDYANDMDGVQAFIGSKYVQARIGNAYTDVKQFLIQGKKVLFSGTPCQVAGLHKFLRKTYDNLLTTDFVCHGSPSPTVWRIFLDNTISHCQRISDIGIKNSKLRLNNFSFSLQYNHSDKTVSLFSHIHENPYMAAFLNNITLRPSCYKCRAKGGRSHSDITIADFWGIDTILTGMNDNKGISLVFLNTPKGHCIFNSYKIFTKEVAYTQVKTLNPACYRSSQAHLKRTEFFTHLRSKNIIDLISHYTRPTMKERIGICILRCKYLIKKIIDTISKRQKDAEKATPQATELPTHGVFILKHPKIVYINFRNKGLGWNRYRMEIKLKGAE